MQDRSSDKIHVDVFSVSRSKFCELRPKHVKLFAAIPHLECVCRYHENVRSLLCALNPYTSFSNDLTSFTAAIVCNPENKECMFMRCSACIGNQLNFRPSENQNLTLSYYQWINSQKMLITKTVDEAFSELQGQLEPFLMHVYIKRKQFSYMQQCKQSCNGKKICLQVDFSENASLQHQNEIQSAHWNHSQATLFTAYAWIDSENKESFAIVSNDLDHTKQSVYSFKRFLLATLCEKYPSINQVDIFSDGAASQFKQRFFFCKLGNVGEQVQHHSPVELFCNIPW